MNNKDVVSEQLLLSEVQVLLAEKRTYFAFFRTGLAVVTVPFTIIIFLAATASYHRMFEHDWFGIVTVILLLSISGTGVYLTYEAIRKIKKINEHIRDAEKSNKRIDDIIV